MIKNLPDKPKIKDTWYVIPTERYVLFRGQGLFRVEGKNLKEFVESMLPLLSGNHTLGEIIGSLSEYREKDVVTALEMLNKEGVLEDAAINIPKNLSESELEQFQSNLDYFNHFSENKYECLSRLRRARVVILGFGALARSITSSLARLGVGEVLFIDDGKKDEYQNLLNGIWTNNKIKVESLGSKTDIRNIINQYSKYDLLIGVPEAYNPAFFNEVNRACLRNKIPWIPVYYFEGEGFIGPLVASGEKACYQCLLTRLLTNSEHLEEDKVLNQHLSRNGHELKSFIPRFYADVISNLVVKEVVDFLSGAKIPSTLGGVYIHEFETFSGKLHRIIKVPNCPVCIQSNRKLGTRDLLHKEGGKWSGLMVEKDSNEELSLLVTRIEELQDDRTGIIKKTIESNSSSFFNLFDTYGCSVIGSSLNRMHKSQDFILSGGTDETFEKAKCAALVEAIERYCCGTRDEKRIIRATYDQVKGNAMNPRDMALFSGKQYSSQNFPWKRFSEDIPISWTFGFNLINEQVVLVPADFVYTGVNEDKLCPETSNGAAAHTSKVRAILRGILEVVERDGLMIMWFNQLPMPKISLDSLPSETLRIVNSVNKFGFDVVVQNITTDIGIPAFVILIVNKCRRKPALFSGAGCHLEPEVAVIKGLREAIRFLAHHLSNPGKSNAVKTPGLSDLRTPEDHGNLYFDPEMLDHLDFIIKSGNYQNLDKVRGLQTKDPVSALKVCLNKFRKKRMDVIAVDCTSRDVVDTGLRVMKVIIPGMQSIGFGMNNQRLGGERLYHVPKKLGYSRRIRGEEDLNRIPHFFA